MKSLIRYFTTIVFFLITIFAFANDDRRVEVGSRQLTEAEKKELFEQEKKEFASSEKKELYPTIYDNQYPPLVFNHYIHNLVGISVLGDYLIIEDGSQWNIKYGSSKEAFSWKDNDPIMIIKNNSFYSSYFYGYKYKMINTRTGSAIEVKLHLSPILDNPYTLQVVAIDPTTSEIILSDNSLWQLDPSQKKLLMKWTTKDVIIIGTNSKGWFNNSYDNILINVNWLQEIRANRVE